ncbi:MAG: AAA family ATPase, partial [Phycisphaeraceae bacterium]|nr:AAA family ATPase [Phycisphaeraceae bacterium]
MAERIEAAADQLLESVEVVELAIAPLASVDAQMRADGLSVFERHNSQRYTTLTTLAREQMVLDHVDAGRDAAIGIAHPIHVADAIDQRAAAGQPLSPDQEAAVVRITQSGEAFVPLVGPAGAGKSKTLEAVNDAYQRSGIPVRGLAPSAKAAAVLRTEAGIEQSDTLAKLLYEQDRAGVTDQTYIIQRGEIIVLDEASMAATGDLARLVDLAKVADAKIVAVGDYRQLGAVDAGGL